MSPSDYEENALREIHAWKNPSIGWFGQAMKIVNWPVNKAGDLMLSVPGVGDAFRLTVQGLASLCNDVAHFSVQRESIYAAFRRVGHDDIHKEFDVHELDLEDVDKVVGYLAAKYKGIALVQGAGTGAAGILGIPPNLVALLTLNLRAIGEYATYYGFNISLQQERLFAMNVLGLASSPTDASKGLAMAQLTRIAQDTAKKSAWSQLEQHSFVQVMQQIAKALGVRLTKAKVAQIVPVAGAVVGGGFDSYFTSKVCDAAYFLYRERFLAQKYGPSYIEAVVEPAAELDPHYPEEDESIP